MSKSRISADVRQRVRQSAGDRCGYCLSPQLLVLGRLEIDHIVPSAKGGSDEEDNLWLACSLCNRYKGAQAEGIDSLTGDLVSLFDPRRQRWLDHFAWVDPLWSRNRYFAPVE